MSMISQPVDHHAYIYHPGFPSWLAVNCGLAQYRCVKVHLTSWLRNTLYSSCGEVRNVSFRLNLQVGIFTPAWAEGVELLVPICYSRGHSGWSTHTQWLLRRYSSSSDAEISCTNLSFVHAGSGLWGMLEHAIGRWQDHALGELCNDTAGRSQ